MTDEVDIAVIGAGPAGIAAARRLIAAKADVIVLEARPRVGGRAHTIIRDGVAIDVGAGWLHSADENPLSPLAERIGFEIDRTPPPWNQQAFNLGMTPEERADFRAAFDAFDQRVEAAAKDGPDRPASDLFDPDGRWNARMDAVSGALNGARFGEVSAQDYAGYEDSGVNWRVPAGYGALFAALAEGLPIALDRPVTRVDRTGPRLVLETPSGAVSARAVIVTVPTRLIAEEAIRFDPPLPDLTEAAHGVPLGLAAKHHMAVTGAEDFPKDSQLWGRADSADTAGYHLRPFGRGMIEAYFGGPLAWGLEAEGEAAFHAFAVDELVSLLGSDMRKRLKPLSTSMWGADPWSRGAYSYARPGHAGDRARLRAPVEDRIFLAGEATCTRFYGTAHGAWMEGGRAADFALQAVAA